MAFKNLALLFVFSLLVGTITSTEPPIKPGYNLEARLFGEGRGGGIVDCLNALLQLKKCTNEIVLFFLENEMYLGQDCCKAIRVITLQCWPTMLTSLGFTPEEGDILEGYCGGGELTIPPTAGSVPSPVKAPSVKV